jgi:hypothetical protein
VRVVFSFKPVSNGCKLRFLVSCVCSVAINVTNFFNKVHPRRRQAERRRARNYNRARARMKEQEQEERESFLQFRSSQKKGRRCGEPVLG